MKQNKIDVSQWNNIQEKTDQLHQQKQKIISRLNETNNYLSSLHYYAVRTDFVFTGVSLAGGVGVAAAALCTGVMSLYMFGSAQLIGSFGSYGTQYYEELKTQECLDRLQDELQQYTKKLKEIDPLVHSVKSSVKRLKKFTKSLNKLVEAGLFTIGNKYFNSEASNKIKREIFENDDFFKFFDQGTKHSIFQEVLQELAHPDHWNLKIYMLKFANSLSTLVKARSASTLVKARSAKDATAQVASAVGSKQLNALLAGVNVLTIFLDAVHLVDFISGTGETDYVIKEIRQTIDELQRQ